MANGKNFWNLQNKIMKISTNEMQKIKDLIVEVEKFKAAMAGTKQAIEDTTKAMREFVEACSKIKMDS
jgi:succinate dehydrogenase/fumarate reductase-like Fe-S protein